VSFNRYEKMIVSKERVAMAKASFQGEVRTRIVIPIDYQKRLKQQSKMLKLQSGKIQKLTQVTQRHSRNDCSGMT
jgi:hypothetical protein